MLTQTGRFETPHARKYLQQLCKHFAHKVDVSFTPERADVAFPFGPARLMADTVGLVAEICGDSDEALARGRGVIDVHLKTFAFRESFQEMSWEPIGGDCPKG